MYPGLGTPGLDVMEGKMDGLLNDQTCFHQPGYQVLVDIKEIAGFIWIVI